MKSSIKVISCIFVSALLYGCGTIYTVSADAENLKQEACSYDCSLPRVYSGVLFDICGITEEDAGQGGAILFWDLFFSIPADTVILPYTIFMQVKEGSIANAEICSQETSPSKQRQPTHTARLL